MKKLLFLLSSLLTCQLIFAQTKVLPGCVTIRNELTTVNNSFDNIVNRFKSKEDKISLVKTYFSEFSICNEKGKIKDYGKNVEFRFYFTETDYEGKRDDFKDFYKKILRKLKDEFSITHIYRSVKDETGKSCLFYEKDKDITSSKRNIKLVLSYKDPTDETQAYSVSLIFEYYPKR